MTSKINQILDVIGEVLAGVPDIKGVFDSPEIALDRGDFPCIVIAPPESYAVEPLSDCEDITTVLFAVSVLVAGDPWRGDADVIACAAFTAITSSPEIEILVDSIRKHGREWQGHNADQSYGEDKVIIRVKYITRVNEI